MKAVPDNSAGRDTYLNPVYRRACPDPFVLKHRNEYWCYCTGAWADGRAFGVLHSRDLVNWREVGGALLPLEGQHPCYWAPEVWFENGQFLMYYSVGNETRMQIRVAVADHPAGPFIDSGRALTGEEFAIDAHVFQDDDGQRYLFYATDFLTHTHIGTGTVRDRMLDLFTLAGQPQPVTRAKYDWQVYHPNRPEKGGVRWHTVEGPFVLKHKGTYYEMFSGGNWQNDTYGASYAVAASLEKADEWEQVADGQQVLPILRTIPGIVIGPGHNSVVRGPDNVQQYCIYHRWDQEINDRVLAIDRLDWVGQRMYVLGASITPQPAPNPAIFTDYFDTVREGLGEHWQAVSGNWRVQSGAAVQQATESHGEARLTMAAPHFSAEVTVQMLSDAPAGGSAGLSLSDDRGALLWFKIVPSANQAVLTWQTAAPGADAGEGWVVKRVELPAGFKPDADHLLRAEVNARLCRLSLDGQAMTWEGQLGAPASSIALVTEKAAAAFAGFALTAGWQDLFTERDVEPAALGWTTQGAGAGWRLAEQTLQARQPAEAQSVLLKGQRLEAYELVVNARLVAQAGNRQGYGGYGLLPAVAADRTGPLLVLEQAAEHWALRSAEPGAAPAFALPADFDPFQYHQFRFIKRAGRLTVQLEARVLGEIAVAPEPTNIGLYAHGVNVDFDLVRVTAIHP